ncbi:alpha/beta hydrolase [Flavobacteriaceae bacterium TP-CH-4]|uniref:Alpha/beta hydrolase n=1 Tax=Pelagihabitans pacificus TaxID=2696054 RepID=A0A967ATP8_9FLAO|nr:alpha/beta fold hydrolase [Pelagihabitans pacificus]NHF60128.1 alpha/beta hydrolase [Pelagihabitans pacificus]
MKRLKKIALVLFILYALLVILAYNFQEKLIFIPSKMPANHEYEFCQYFEEFYLTAEDGAKLNAVHIKQDSAKGVVLYFHGNSGNISHLGHVANLLSRKGYDAIMVDYRTYGKSTGEMSEQALKKDAQLFYNHTLTKYEEDEIVLYGRSFGTGIASGLAADNSPRKLILESPFYSAIELGKHRFPILPIDWLSQYRFPSHEYVKQVKCPVYIFHGTEDAIIPYEQAEDLYAVIPGDNKKFYRIEGGGHNYLQDFDGFKKGMEEVFN